MARGKRRQWRNLSISSNSVADGVQLVGTILDVSTTPDLRGAKVLRAVGEWSVRSDHGGIISGINCVYLGLVAVHQDMDAAGVYPDPASDFDSSWVFQLSMGLIHDTDKGVAGTFRAMPFDIKSNRKVARQSDLVLIYENQSSRTTSIDVHGRLLIEVD